MTMAETFTCAKCKTEKDGYGEHLYRRGFETWDRVCAECEVAVWPVPIHFIFHWGIPEWVEPHMKSSRVLKNLKQWFRDGATCYVHFFSREEVHTLGWQYKWNQWDREKEARKPFSFRGWCGGGSIVIIVDNMGIETPESVEWITYHELGHHECQSRAHMADNAWNAENKNEGRNGYEWEEDAGHEADSEERHVNRLATAFMGGREYARPWWRKRVNAHLAGEKPENFPDCHAEPKVEPAPVLESPGVPVKETDSTEKFQGICADEKCACKQVEKKKKAKSPKIRAKLIRRNQ